MAEYIIGKAKVRINGSPSSDRFIEATVKFLKKAEVQRKKAIISNTERIQPVSNANPSRKQG